MWFIRWERTGTAWLWVLAVLPVGTAAQAGVTPAQLTALENKKLDPVAKARLGLRLYRDEMVDPTPAPKAPTADPKTHDWVLAQITRKLAHVGADGKILRQAYDGANPGAVKDSLRLFLALKGDASLLPALTTYVLDRRQPLRLRELGVQALGRLGVKTGDAKIGDTLAQVLREDSAGVYRSASHHGDTEPRSSTRRGKKMGSPAKSTAAANSKTAPTRSSAADLVIEYPLRKAAAQAIGALEKAGVLLPSYVTQAAKQAQFAVKFTPGKPPATAGPTR